MARARNIKPGFFKNEDLGTADPYVSLLFAGLWTLADKAGILEDRPLRIRAELFPYRDNFDVNGYLTVLVSFKLIYRYEVEGVRYIEIANFKKHQTPHHTEKASEYPSYSDSCKITVVSPLKHGATPSDSLIPDSLIPDSLIPDSLIPDSVATDKPPQFSFLKSLLDAGVSEQLAKDYIAARKAKKCVQTHTAFSLFSDEVKKSGLPMADVVAICCKKSWGGFEADWLLRDKLANARASPQQSLEARNRAVAANWVPPEMRMQA